MIHPVLFAILELGVSGVPGPMHNKKILEYFVAADASWIKDDETPWCAAFMSWCFWRASIGGVRSVRARDWLMYGEPTSTPRFGDVVVLWRGSPASQEGHVGFFMGELGDSVIILGGNQKNSVCAWKYPKSQVLGFRTSSRLQS